MDNIFEILIQIVMAYFQIIMILFGVLFFAFGISSFLDATRKKKNHHHWFTGTVVAVREGEGIPDENGAKGKIYYPVFEGIGQDGKMHRYECKTNSRDINHYKAGDRFEVTFTEGQNDFVCIKGDEKADIIIGVFLCALGSFLFGVPIKLIPFSHLTFVVWGITTMVIIFKFAKHIKLKNLRETMEKFKLRRGTERLQRHQNQRFITRDDIIKKEKLFNFVAPIMSKISLLIGFAILCAGGIGYNSQAEFIDNAVLERVGPCGLELGEDCPRVILFQDLLSMIPIELRPVMEGIYHSRDEPDKIIVSYGYYTPLPYMIVMAIGALTMLSAIRLVGRTKKSNVI